jgi:hypothetical protein
VAGYTIANLHEVENIATGSDRPEDGDGEMVRDWWTD